MHITPAIDELSPLNSPRSFAPPPSSQLPFRDSNGAAPAVPAPFELSYANSDDFNGDCALDGDAILADLELPDKPKADGQTKHSNSKVTAMMALQRAEDAWLQAIQAGFHAGLTQDDLKDFLSPSISRRLTLHNDTVTAEDELFEFSSNCATGPTQLESLTSSTSSDSSRTSLSPAIELLRLDDSPNDLNRFEGFEIQRKRSRFQSYGIR
jgi:hypothetical protein